MGDEIRRRGSVLHLCLCCCLMACFMAELGVGNVVLMANNETLSFEDVEATFAPSVKSSGVKGVVYLAEPLDGCIQFTNKAVEDSVSPFALIIRGPCQFDEKVRNAQDAGYKGAIIYNNEDNGGLVSMAGSSSGIDIYAVFVSKSSGELLKRYSGRTDAEIWILPALENSAWSILTVSFISLLAMSAVLATCFFVRRHRIRRERPRNEEIREFHGMNSRLVKAIPSIIFTKVQDEKGTSEKCAICQQEYCLGDKLRVLHCGHQYHMLCVDEWLTEFRAWCPVCKRDARVGIPIPPPSETTPLTATDIRSPIQSPVHTSFRTLRASPLPIARNASRQSITYSFSGSAHSPKTIGPHTNSHIDLRSSSPSRNHTSYQSAGYASSVVTSSGYGSANLLGSLGRQSFLRHCGDSGPSLCTLVGLQSQSPYQSQMQLVGDVESNLAAVRSTQSFRMSQSPHQSQMQLAGDAESYLAAVRSTQSFRTSHFRNRSESETSISLSSAQSLPGVSHNDGS